MAEEAGGRVLTKLKASMREYRVGKRARVTAAQVEPKCEICLDTGWVSNSTDSERAARPCPECPMGESAPIAAAVRRALLRNKISFSSRFPISQDQINTFYDRVVADVTEEVMSALPDEGPDKGVVEGG